jgi:hypothetical protein
MVELLQGDLVEFYELLNCLELQEGCSASAERGSKLRRIGAIDRDHEEHWFYSCVGISRVRKSRLQLFKAEIVI